MKTFKKLITLVMIVMMLAAMFVPAHADDTYSITITNAKGHSFKAYQIFKGSLSGKVLSDVVWGDDVNFTALLTALKSATNFSTGISFASCSTAADVADVMKGGITSKWVEADTNRFAALVHANLVTNAVADSANADENGTAVIGNLAAGYYLVVDVSNLGDPNDPNDPGDIPHDAMSKYIVNVSSNTVVESKVDLPTLSKTVSRTKDSGYGPYINAAFGETVYYKVTATMHTRISDYNNYYLEFVDTLPAGITFGKIEALIVNDTNYIHAASPDAPDVPGPNNLVGANASKNINDYIVCTTASNSINISVKDAKDTILQFTGAPAISTDTITVIYSANVAYAADANDTTKTTKYGAEGNANKAVLKFSNNPYGNNIYNNGEPITTSSTTIASATVYTHRMAISKVDAANGTALAGAQFKLYYKPGDGTSRYAIVGGTAGNYYVTGTTTDENEATTILCDANGRCVIMGLNAREYHIKEVMAPSGYNKINTDQIITISILEGTANAVSLFKTSSVGAFTTANYNNTDKVIEISISNNQGATMPTTGGMGTTVFYIVGLALVMGAAVLLISRKRKGAEG